MLSSIAPPWVPLKSRDPGRTAARRRPRVRTRQNSGTQPGYRALRGCAAIHHRIRSAHRQSETRGRRARDDRLSAHRAAGFVGSPDPKLRIRPQASGYCRPDGLRQDRGSKLGSRRTTREPVTPAWLPSAHRPVDADASAIALRSDRRVGDCCQTSVRSGNSPIRG